MTPCKYIYFTVVYWSSKIGILMLNITTYNSVLALTFSIIQPQTVTTEKTTSFENH